MVQWGSKVKLSQFYLPNTVDSLHIFSPNNFCSDQMNLYSTQKTTEKIEVVRKAIKNSLFLLLVAMK